MNDETMGRIDALVAEKVMGWKKIEEGVLWWWEIPGEDPHHEDWNGHSHTPEYTRDPAAMMEVIEAMRKDGRKVTYETGYFGGRCVNDVVISMNMKPGSRSGEADADTMPLAVALASLKAHGVEVPK